METNINNSYPGNFSTKDKYVKVIEKTFEPRKRSEIHISNLGAPKKYFNYGINLLLKKNYHTIQIKASGMAISKGFIVVELLKRRIPNLHQINEVETIKIVNKFEPLEEGLDVVFVENSLGITIITLSKKILDKNHYGYQSPLPLSQVNEYDEENLDKIEQIYKGKNKQPKKGIIRDYSKYNDTYESEGYENERFKYENNNYETNRYRNKRKERNESDRYESDRYESDRYESDRYESDRYENERFESYTCENYDSLNGHENENVNYKKNGNFEERNYKKNYNNYDYKGKNNYKKYIDQQDYHKSKGYFNKDNEDYRENNYSKNNYNKNYSYNSNSRGNRGRGNYNRGNRRYFKGNQNNNS